MKRMTLALVLTTLTVSACSSFAEKTGPFARQAKSDATQTDVMINDAGEPEANPFPVQSPFGN